jgi:glycosidase
MMSQPYWWQSGVVYQIYPRSFKDSNGDGVGDLQGIIDRLDYLKQLGVGAIWISPFFKSPMKDFGYDVADYCDVDPLFGDLATFDRLVQAAHDRGIRLIIDWVPNHTSDEHPWFVESRSSRDNPRRDWYIWKDARPDGSLPNNWGSAFGGPAWAYDEKTGQYYFHQFVPGQPDLNWRNPQVRAAMHDVLRFWLDRGVDGFRMDVVNMIWKHPDMPDQPPDPNARPRSPNDIHNTQQHIYDWDYEGVHERMREFRLILDQYGDTLMIGEIWLPIDRWVRYFGTPEAPEFQLPFNFRLMETAWTPQNVRQEIALMEANVPPHGYPNYVLNNHDKPRFNSRVGQEQSRGAAMLLLTLRGTPTIYQGEELGMVDGDIQPHQMRDPQGINLGVAYTRDVTRTPFQWDDSPYAGFSEAEPWLPVNADYPQRNALRQMSDPTSHYALYHRLIALRRAETAFSIGSLALQDLHPDVVAYTRDHEGRRFAVVVSFSSRPISIQMPFRGEIIVDTQLKRAGEPVNDALELWAYEGVVIALK